MDCANQPKDPFISHSSLVRSNFKFTFDGKKCFCTRPECNKLRLEYDDLRKWNAGGLDKRKENGLDGM